MASYPQSQMSCGFIVEIINNLALQIRSHGKKVFSQMIKMKKKIIKENVSVLIGLSFEVQDMATEIWLKAVGLNILSGDSHKCAVDVTAIFMATLSSHKELTIKEIIKIASVAVSPVLECYSRASLTSLLSQIGFDFLLTPSVISCMKCPRAPNLLPEVWFEVFPKFSWM